jgi:hypothetical protein
MTTIIERKPAAEKLTPARCTRKKQALSRQMRNGYG